MCNFEFLQVIIAFFSKTVWPRNMKFGLHRVSIWVNIQKKFQVPRSHSIGEKCDANFKLSSHFSRKLCDRGTWNLVCIEYPYGLIYKKNFKFLGRTVSEKNAMLTCKISKLFIRAMCNFEFLQVIIAFFSKTVWPRNMKFGLHRVSIWVNIQKKFQVPRSHSIGEKCDANCKISKLFIRTIVQLWIFASYHRIFLENCATEEHEIWFAKSIHMG